jgi:hypothetical protein
MTDINTKTPRINLGLSVGVIALLTFGIIVGGYFIQETKKTADDAKNISADFDKRVSTFIENWEKRVRITNEVNNVTQRNLLGLSTNASQILQQQLTNEQHILGNLTAHRHVANYTRDITFKILNQSLEQEKQLIDLQNKTDTLTGSQYAKLADMRVKSIIGNISKEHEQIEQQHNQIIKYLGNLTNVR